MRPLLLLSMLALVACGGRYRGADRPAPAKVGVEAAALPYALVDGRTGRAVTEPELYAALAAARAICVGEDHPNPHHHWAQLTIVDGVATHLRGKRLALGMEMVQTPFQGVLDDWTAGTIDEPALLSRTGWADRWGYDFTLYRPILERARAAGMALLALNAPRELVKAVSRKGVDGLSADERARLPALVLDDAQHRAWFDAVMDGLAGHGHGHGQGQGHPADPHAAPAHGEGAPTPTHGEAPPTHGEAPAHGAGPPAGPTADSIYAAQAVWDESMAEASHRWLGAGGETIVILAGNGHCHDSAIVRRLVRRGGGPAVSIRPIIDDGQGNVARALAEAHNDYLFVMSVPTAASP